MLIFIIFAQNGQKFLENNLYNISLPNLIRLFFKIKGKAIKHEECILGKEI